MDAGTIELWILGDCDENRYSYCVTDFCMLRQGAVFKFKKG